MADFGGLANALQMHTNQEMSSQSTSGKHGKSRKKNDTNSKIPNDHELNQLDEQLIEHQKNQYEFQYELMRVSSI